MKNAMTLGRLKNETDPLSIQLAGLIDGIKETVRRTRGIRNLHAEVEKDTSTGTYAFNVGKHNRISITVYNTLEKVNTDKAIEEKIHVVVDGKCVLTYQRGAILNGDAKGAEEMRELLFRHIPKVLQPFVIKEGETVEATESIVERFEIKRLCEI